MNRTKGILAAGTLTGLILVTLLALGFSNIGAKSGDEETAVSTDSVQAVSDPTPITIQQPVDNSADEAAVQAWQDYATELENTVNTMQQREGEYQTQLDTANQTIIGLQDQVNSTNAAASTALNAPASAPASAPANYGDDDHGESDDHGNESHEVHEDGDD